MISSSVCSSLRLTLLELWPPDCDLKSALADPEDELECRAILLLSEELAVIFRSVVEEMRE